MHIDRDALRKEYEPKARQWAATKVKRLRRNGGALVDANAIEGEALEALERAIDTWQGAGAFEGYFRTALNNAWRDEERRERRHRHTAYPAVKEEGSDPNSSEAYGDLVEIDGDPLANGNGDALPVFRARGKRYRGGDSVVVIAAMQREQAADFVKGGLAEVLRKMGASPAEIREAIKEKNRRVYLSDYRHPERAALRFEALFKPEMSA